MTHLKKQTKVLGIFALAMINVSLICSLRGLPLMAEYGLAIVFFLLIAVLFFLVPSALVSAELATTWEDGGVYGWVRRAFGERWGFLASWLQWSQNLVFYPTALAATAAVIAYIFMPSLANNSLFTFFIIFVVYWGATLINFRGMKLSGMISSIGVITGIILPGVVLIASAAIWLLTGNNSQIPLTFNNFIPDFSNINNITFFSGIILFFAGMEVSANHAREVKDPKKDYPKAILLSAIIIITIFMLGSLAIAVILPQADISLTAGIMQTYYKIFDHFNILWLIPVLAVLAAPGMIAQVSTWIAGPSRGLLMTADNGNLPPFFQHKNKHNMPTHIFIIQGCIVSVISLVFLLMPSVSSSFWILTALTAMLYLIMYILLFMAAIKLKYSEASVERPYKVPGGKLGMWFFAGIGMIAAIVAIVIGFIPPAQLGTGNIIMFEVFLIAGVLIMCGVPMIIYAFRKPHWKMNSDKKKEDE